MRNIKLVLEYDGTGYYGWQSQELATPQARSAANRGDTVPSIQETLEGAIEHLTGKRSLLIASGRTDAGVHALAQVASFKTDSDLDAATIKRALNALLPLDIRVIDASEAEESFHPRYSAVSKRYIYLINCKDSLPVFMRRFVWHIPYKLNIKDMAQAAGLLQGKHDFAAFRGSGCGAKTTIREVMSLTIKEMEFISFLTWQFHGNFINIGIEANAFLRHMARNIVGTLVQAGRGRINPTSIPDIIASGNRSLAGPTAPSMGLFLERVNYSSFSTT